MLKHYTKEERSLAIKMYKQSMGGHNFDVDETAFDRYANHDLWYDLAHKALTATPEQLLQAYVNKLLRDV